MEQPRTVMSSVQHTAVLICHPETYSQVAHGIEARVRWVDAGALALHYILKGDTNHLRIPPSRAPRWADYLWRHTCFEAFIAVKGKPEYCEFNFSPSGEWAAYRFRRYREGAPLEDGGLSPGIAARCTDDRLDLDATIHFHRLSNMSQNGRLSLGLSAVIEAEKGVFSYWALKHPPGKPDFHHPDAFALEIERPDMEIINQGRTEKR